MLIFTSALDLNKKWMKKESEIVLVVNKSFEEIIKDFNVQYQKRILEQKINKPQRN